MDSSYHWTCVPVDCQLESTKEGLDAHYRGDVVNQILLFIYLTYLIVFVFFLDCLVVKHYRNIDIII